VTYLDGIVAWHRARVAADQRDTNALLQAAHEHPALRVGDASSRPSSDAAETDFVRRIVRSTSLAVVAEIKRCSPSKGAIARDLVVSNIAREYADGGATCLSVLTDAPHFCGSTSDLQEAKRTAGIPVLRKDFTVHEHDIIDARLMGADAVLLIAAVLSDDELLRFHRLALELRLAPLVEVHDEAELERAVKVGATLIGVNQRDLVTFDVDVERAARLARMMPRHVISIAESGITGVDDARRCADAGYRAVLVGEHLVRSHNREAALRELQVELAS
jgi:indole-3-glycerol phosphate synthase